MTSDQAERLIAAIDRLSRQLEETRVRKQKPVRRRRPDTAREPTDLDRQRAAAVARRLGVG